MPHDPDRIKQRAGYIEKAIDHAARHSANAEKARQAGNERQAKTQETKAKTYLNRAQQSARNIAERVK